MEQHFSARRLLAGDAGEALRLYAAGGRDAAWAVPAALARAELWGGFAGAELVLCAGLALCSAPFSLGEAMGKTGLAASADTLLLPPAAAPCGALYLPEFLRMLTARALQTARPSAALFALLGVKSGTPLTAAYFEAGFALRAMRPLYELRAHYLFCPRAQNACGGAAAQNVQNACEPCIMVPIEDSLRLSRLLAVGYTGTALAGGQVRLEREESADEGRDSGELCAAGGRP